VNKQQYLAHSDVSSFIDWFIDFFPQLTIHLKVKSSQFVPNGINKIVYGGHTLINDYFWKTSWSDVNSKQVIQSSDWLSTKLSIHKLKTSLVNAKNDTDLLQACYGVLEWGGERNPNYGARPFLTQKAQQQQLKKYLTDCQQALCLQSANLSHLSVVTNMNAMLTKVHAFYNDDGLPIYDSRVAGAIAMLVEIFRSTYYANKWLHVIPSVLEFPVADQVRRIPKNYKANAVAVPILTTNNQHLWVSAKVRLGWLIHGILAKLEAQGEDWFKSELTIADKSRALEACFFVLGYDLQWVSGGGNINNSLNIEQNYPRPTRGWVPTVHNFTTVIQCYLEFRSNTNIAHDYRKKFIAWLLEKGIAGTNNSASAMCFPLALAEFNLYERPIEELQQIAQGNLDVAMQHTTFNFGERNMVCLVDCYLAGKLYDLSPTDRANKLIELGYAGTANAATAIMTVGRNIGRHFGLLDNQKKPTQRFKAFFQGRYPDIEADLEE
jgi:hypothetical protein